MAPQTPEAIISQLLQDAGLEYAAIRDARGSYGYNARPAADGSFFLLIFGV